jgi:hypothetical protein
MTADTFPGRDAVRAPPPIRPVWSSTSVVNGSGRSLTLDYKVPSDASASPPDQTEYAHGFRKAYRQGQLDALASSLLAPPWPGTEVVYSPPPSTVPTSLQSFASRYPLTAIATIGAVSALTLISSSYLASRAFRRLTRTPVVNKDEWLRGRLDDLERRVVDHISSSGLNRRKELDMFRKELMAKLGTFQPAVAHGQWLIIVRIRH